MLLLFAFAGSAALCVYSSQRADAWLGFRTAVQISGWLCILAVLAGFSTRVARNRRELGEVTAAATGFFTGAAMLYLSYFQWSEAPVARATPVVAKTAPAVWNPAEHLPRAKLSASAGGSAPEVPRIAWPRPPHVLVDAVPVSVPGALVADNPCFGLTGAASLQCARCSAESGLAWLFCEERARLEYCRAGADADPECPSVIPVSPPR
ncbi:MAG TPA: hypothetical protein VFJ70_15230 [Burkholderiales bacterium]|nr:hypothetical protein [Burkholderiales bacterium]